MTAGRPPSVTTSTSSPSARSSVGDGLGAAGHLGLVEAARRDAGDAHEVLEVGTHLRHEVGHAGTDPLDLVGGQDWGAGCVGHASTLPTSAARTTGPCAVRLPEVQPRVRARWFTRAVDAVDEAFEAVPRSGLPAPRAAPPRRLRRAAVHRPRGDLLAAAHRRRHAPPARRASRRPGARRRVGLRLDDRAARPPRRPHGRVVGRGDRAAPRRVGRRQRRPRRYAVGDGRCCGPAACSAGPAGAPWDRILVSAEARHLPQPLVDQLADPGRLVVPVAGRMTLVVLDGGVARTSEHGYYRFVPLQTPTSHPPERWRRRDGIHRPPPSCGVSPTRTMRETGAPALRV